MRRSKLYSSEGGKRQAPEHTLRRQGLQPQWNTKQPQEAKEHSMGMLFTLKVTPLETSLATKAAPDHDWVQ